MMSSTDRLPEQSTAGPDGAPLRKREVTPTWPFYVLGLLSVLAGGFALGMPLLVKRYSQKLVMA
jgi:hypothetical protein